VTIADFNMAKGHSDVEALSLLIGKSNATSAMAGCILNTGYTHLKSWPPRLDKKPQGFHCQPPTLIPIKLISPQPPSPPLGSTDCPGVTRSHCTVLGPPR
jgi:hypothetical protein